MAYTYVPGTGLVNNPEPIVVKTSYIDKKSNAERASLLPDDKQNQQYVNDGNMNHLVADITKALVEKHELIGAHAHDVLKPSDVDYADDLDGEGNLDADEVTEGDPDYADELDENGNPVADKLVEADLQMGLAMPKIGKSVFVPMFNVDCEVAAVDDDFVTVLHGGLRKSLTIDEVMPA